MSLEQSLDNILPDLQEYADLRAQKKDIEERMKALDERVRPALVSRGPVTHAGYRFECKIMEGVKTFDKRLMADDGIDIDKYLKQGAPFTRMEIKEVS
jgi:hypothetical protein